MTKIKFAHVANPEARNPGKVQEARRLVKQLSEKEINASDPFFYNRVMSRFFNGSISLQDLQHGSHS